VKKTHVDTSQLLLELIGHSEHGPVEVLFLAEFEEVLERSRFDQRKGGPDLLDEEDDLVVVDVGVLESGKDLGGLLVSALLDQPTGDSGRLMTVQMIATAKMTWKAIGTRQAAGLGSRK
jgi:hypothetical protein